MGLSDVAKNMAVGVIPIHNERLRASAFPCYVAFSPFIRERPDKSPTLSILRVPREQVHSHPMTLYRRVSIPITTGGHVRHSQKATWVSQRLERQGN